MLLVCRTTGPVMVLAFVFAFFLYLLLLGIAWWYYRIPTGLPPGPIGLPFIGSAIHTWKRSQIHITLFKWLDKYGPIYSFYVGHQLVVILGRWDLIQDAMIKQSETYHQQAPFLAIAPKNISRNKDIKKEGTHAWQCS